MLKYSEKILNKGYTIYISKLNETLQGTFHQNFADGIHVFELPSDEITPLSCFDAILNNLETGALLQVHQDGRQITSIVGLAKKEGPQCKKGYLEVLGKQSGTDYLETLVGLDAKLREANNSNVIQYTKLYKGVDRYE